MSIDVTGVTKRFGDFVALDDVTVSLPTGQLTALLGPSGGGKSTLLRIIAGLDNADAGTVTIEGEATTCRRASATWASSSSTTRCSSTCRWPRTSRSGWRSASGPRLRSSTAWRSCSSSSTSAVPRPYAVPALGWTTSADGPRARTRGRAQRAPAGRAVRSPRRQGAQGAARLAATAARRGPHDDDLRDPRPGGGARGRRQIVVINEGRVEQVGAPDELYDTPANDFVMRFLGETTDLAGRTVRPHDIEVSMTPADSARHPAPCAGSCASASRCG